MGVKDSDLVSRRGWPAGLNNTSNETALATGRDARVPAELRDALNVDISGDGKPTRRPGYAQIHTGPAHSAWSDDYFPHGYYVRNDTLYALSEDTTETQILTGLDTGLPLDYARLNDTVLWSNGSKSGLITEGLDNQAWSCECPGGQPTVTVGSGGSLPAGNYQVAVTFVDSRGRESGTGLATAIDLPDNSALLLDNIPQPTSAEVVRIRIYVTSGFDEILRLHAVIPSNVTSYVVAQKVDGKPLSTQFLVDMPAGHIVRVFNGRQLVARENTMLFSPYLHYGLYNPVNHRIAFTSRVTLMQPVADGTDAAGIFVADSKRTYFFPGGNPADWRQVVAYPHGVVPGTAIMTPADVWDMDSDLPVAFWLATNGQMVVGLPGGQVKVVNPKAVTDIGEAGASYLRKDPGDNRVITSIAGAQKTGFGVTDQMTVREYRHSPQP